MQSTQDAHPEVLVTRRIFPDLLEGLCAQANVQDNQPDTIWTPAELRARAQNASAMICTIGEKIDSALIAACPKLKIVANIAVGYNNIDLAACQAHGIAVCNTPDVLTETTADHAWALLLSSARRVSEGERYIRSGAWHIQKPWALDMLLGVDVHHKTLGIFGMGRIGAAIARRAQGFAMRVLYHNRQPVANACAEYVSHKDLLRESDFLVLVLPYSPATHHFIGAAELASMKSSAILINISRGGVVDDGALAQALRVGQIHAAGLDVFENEPNLHPDLLSLENVVLTPHVGSATHDTRRAMAQLAIANIEDWLRGHRPRTQVGV